MMDGGWRINWRMVAERRGRRRFVLEGLKVEIRDCRCIVSTCKYDMVDSVVCRSNQVESLKTNRESPAKFATWKENTTGASRSLPLSL